MKESREFAIGRVFILVILIILISAGATAAFLTFREELNSGNNNTTAVDAVTLIKTIPSPPVQQRFDHLSADVAGNRLFVAATGNSSIYVFDLKSHKLAEVITGLDKPQGVLFIPQLNELIVGNEGNGVVDILNGTSPYHVINSIELGSQADNIQYDPVGKLLYASYGNQDTSGVAVISAVTNGQIANIGLNDGHPEAFQLDTNDSRIFLDDPPASTIDVIDAQNDSVIAKWQLQDFGGSFPETMALDQSDHRLFVGYEFPTAMVVFDTNTGKEVSNVTISQNVDDTFYDSVHRLIFASCGDGHLYVIQQKNADSYQILETFNTGMFARTSLFVPQLNELFVAGPQNNNLEAKISVYYVS